MKNQPKEQLIVIRIQKDRKKNWKQLCEKRNISLTDLIIDSVENRILDDERRTIFNFIERQDNQFKKIETNINQYAKIANSMKILTSLDLKKFSEQMNELLVLKHEQNKTFLKIYELLSK